MIQTQENGEKPHFGPNLGQLGPIGRAIFFFFFFQKSGFASHDKITVMVSYHHVQYYKRLMIQS